MSESQQRALKQEKERRRLLRCKLLNLPVYTVGEEVANAVSHGAGAVFATAALVVLLVFSPRRALTLMSVSIYGGTLFLLYTVSTLYHALGVTKAKKVFQVLDHCTIFLLIAGTYTPITVLCIGGSAGWGLFSVVWAAAVLGIVLNAVNMKKFKAFSMICYLGMGWSVIFAVKPLLEKLDALSLILLLVGGIFYTVGTVRYMHSVWHLFVLVGSVLHFFVVYRIAIGIPA